MHSQPPKSPTPLVLLPILIPDESPMNRDNPTSREQAGGMYHLSGGKLVRGTLATSRRNVGGASPTSRDSEQLVPYWRRPIELRYLMVQLRKSSFFNFF